MKFGQILQELRLGKNLTHNQLAEKIGFSRAIIGHWEKGIRLPTSEALIACAKFFDVSTDYLLGLEDECGVKSDYKFEYTHENTKLIHEERKK